MSATQHRFEVFGNDRDDTKARRTRKGRKHNDAFEQMYAHLQRRMCAGSYWDAKPYALAVDAESATAHALRVRLNLGDPLMSGSLRVWKFTSESAAATARDAFLAQPKRCCPAVQLFHIGATRRSIGRSRGLFARAAQPTEPISTTQRTQQIGPSHPHYFHAAALKATLTEVQRDIVQGVHPVYIMRDYRLSVAQLQHQVISIAVAVRRMRTPATLPTIREYTWRTWQRRFRKSGNQWV